MNDILLIIQDFDPLGVGARDLKECLMLQLERMGTGNSLALRIVSEHLDKMAAKRVEEIANALKASPEEVTKAFEIISSLNPKPGSPFSPEMAKYIEPEVIVRKIEGKYMVFLNDEHLPRVRINQQYKDLMETGTADKEVRDYIKEKIRSGVFLIKSIEQRQHTIFRIATEIVTKQTDFLEHGVSHLKPLTMVEIAAIIGMHETTVSRAVAGKYMQTPRGLFEIKYFFTPGIKTSDGTQISNKTVKDTIEKLIKEENPANPLSDQEIVESLKEKSIPVARRTVAKYRLMLHIPPSHLRKVH